MAQWVCSICGFVYAGDEPPEICPRCGARREDYFEIE